MDIALGRKPLMRSFVRVRFGVFSTIIVWLGAIVVARLWAAALIESGQKLRLDAAPLFGRIDPVVDLKVIPALVVAGSFVWLAPRVAAALSWRRLLIAAPMAAGVWSVAVAVTRGWSSLARPLLDRHDYLRALPAVNAPDFLTSFSERLWTYPIHVQGHPPGMLMFLRGLETAGLGGAGWASAVVIALGASAVAAVLITVRALADEDKARACAPFLVLSPVAVWIATSADAVFMGAAAWTVAMVALSVRASGARGSVTAAAAGVIAGATAFLSYGAVALGSLLLALPRDSRTVLRVGVAACAAASVAVVFYVNGFSWFEGLAATAHRYERGVSATRPYGFFVFNNLVAFSIVLGPAVLFALGRLRDRRVWWIVGATLASVALSDLSGLSKGEVERIWLPFAPWIIVATCAIPPLARRRWLALQAGVALGVQLIVGTPW
jgi:hypothetical protein